jgi:hypothetical protein
MITQVIDLLIKAAPNDVIELQKGLGRQVPTRLAEAAVVILRMLNSSFSVSRKKLSISCCKPCLPILNMLTIRFPKGISRLLVKAPSWPCV